MFVLPDAGEAEQALARIKQGPARMESQSGRLVVR